MEYLDHVGLGHVPRLTRIEWGVIRRYCTPNAHISGSCYTIMPSCLSLKVLHLYVTLVQFSRPTS